MGAARLGLPKSIYYPCTIVMGLRSAALRTAGELRYYFTITIYNVPCYRVSPKILTKDVCSSV